MADLPTDTQLAALSFADLVAFTSAYQGEGQRRSVLVTTPDEIEQTARDYQAAGGDLNALITRIKTVRDQA